MGLLTYRISGGDQAFSALLPGTPYCSCPRSIPWKGHLYHIKRPGLHLTLRFAYTARPRPFFLSSLLAKAQKLQKRTLPYHEQKGRHRGTPTTTGATAHQLRAIVRAPPGHLRYLCQYRYLSRPVPGRWRQQTTPHLSICAVQYGYTAFLNCTELQPAGQSNLPFVAPPRPLVGPTYFTSKDATHPALLTPQATRRRRNLPAC